MQKLLVEPGRIPNLGFVEVSWLQASRRWISVHRELENLRRRVERPDRVMRIYIC
jgi:hypothetical protein